MRAQRYGIVEGRVAFSLDIAHVDGHGFAQGMGAQSCPLNILHK